MHLWLLTAPLPHSEMDLIFAGSKFNGKNRFKFAKIGYEDSVKVCFQALIVAFVYRAQSVTPGMEVYRPPEERRRSSHKPSSKKQLQQSVDDSSEEHPAHKQRFLLPAIFSCFCLCFFFF